MKQTEITLDSKYYIPLYLIFISLLLLASRDFQSAQSSPITLANLHRVISILLEISLITYYFMQRQSIKKIPKTLLFYGLYIVIGMFSALLYSPSFLYDMWKLTELISLFLLGTYIWSVSNGDIKIILLFFNKVILFIQFLLLSVILSVLVNPHEAIQTLQFGEVAVLPFRIQGTIIIINALSVGALSAIILFYKIIEVAHKEEYKILSFSSIWIFLSTVLLITSQSRTSIIGFLLVIFIYYFFINKISYYKRFFFFLFAVPLLTIITPYFSSFIQRGSSSEVMGSLSGRTEWWLFAWNKFINADLLQQLIGFGFASAERKTANESSHGVMNTLDSTYLSSLISTGAVGTIILLLLVLYTNYQLFREARKNKKQYFYIQAFAFMTIITLKTITTGTVNILTYYSLFFIMLIILLKGNNYEENS